MLQDQLDKSEPNMADWSKSLDGMPNFTVNNITEYHEKITKLFAVRSTHIKKNCIRGEQLIEKRFIDLSSSFAKASDDLFCVKTLCSASMKKEYRWFFLALSKTDGEIKFARCCKCAAGKAGTCSHSFALMKIVSKWVIDQRSVIPEEKACTYR